MDLAVLEMTKEEAEERLHEYEAQVREERTAEDEAIRMGYRSAARGLPVVLLSRCIENGGFFENGLPRIAIVRADATQCWVRVRSDEIIYGDRQFADNRGALVGRHTVRVPRANQRGMWQGGSTIVPLVPPKHRPRRNRMRGFHVLWEVEEWTRVPPVDPALLRHVAVICGPWWRPGS